MESKFLGAYQAYAKNNPSGKLNGDRILVEVIEDDSLTKSKGGLYLATAETHRSDFNMLKATIAVVLEVGSGYFNPDTKEDIPLTTKIGEVVWLADTNLRFLTTVPDHSSALPEKTIAVANESAIIKSWPSIEAFGQDRATFSRAASNETK